METTSFSLQTDLQLLDENGFLVLEDAGVGAIVSEMEQREFTFLSSYGLDYLKKNLLDNIVSQPDSSHS